ncbi:hypothetical protein KIN20_008134 [Parelaphostrongylus tenuis]|uniref:Uncharacterized protein n=1 Tax=Parelaphostrongylus tenuis TaxID=148309 RepID=A0AAD5M7I4_PARTN|nr:hypothetical protein KIN20_008134 [Parelaphostrongylus tenuis]
MDDGKSEPSAEELLELVEKQDVMIDCLLQKLEMRNSQIELLRDSDSSKQPLRDEKSELIAKAQQDVSSALTAVDMLQVQNEKLVKELNELRKKNVEDNPVPSIVQLQNRVKELEFDLLRERRSSSNLQADINFQKMRIEQLQSEIDACSNAKAVAVSSLSSKLEDTVKELAELRIKYNSLLDDKESTSSELSSLIEVLTHRSNHLQAHCDVLSTEVAKLRNECKTAECHVATLVEENAALRKKLMRSQIETLDEDQVQRLLTDQSLLISTLREEGRLLLNQLTVERKENKMKWSSLKKENQKLEERLKRLLST